MHATLITNEWILWFCDRKGRMCNCR